MKKLARAIFVVIVVVVLMFGFISFFNFLWDMRMESLTEEIDVAQCPVERSYDWKVYSSKATGFIQEAILAETLINAGSDEAGLANYKDLLIRFRDLEYPECAKPLHDSLLEGFELRVKAYSILEKGGLFAKIRFELFKLEISENDYLILQLIQRIEPRELPDFEEIPLPIQPLPEEVIETV
jgi:hypothetical protein